MEYSGFLCAIGLPTSIVCHHGLEGKSAVKSSALLSPQHTDMYYILQPEFVWKTDSWMSWVIYFLIIPPK